MRNDDIWREAARKFIWDKPYNEISVPSGGKKPRKWFTGGKLNYTKTIFEKNIAGGNALKEAIVFYESASKREPYTYSSLLEKVNSTAGYLRQKGITPKSKVLILTNSKKEQVFLILALFRMGVRFGVLYSKFPPALINSLIQKSKATHILADKKLAEFIVPGKSRLIKLDGLSSIKKSAGNIIPRSVSSSFFSYLCFSSGTTGKKPKIFLTGTAESLVAINEIFQSEFFGDLGNCSVLSTNDFAFGTYPIIVGLFMPLARGGKIVFIDFGYRLNEKHIIKILKDEGIEAIASSPPFFEIGLKKYRDDKIKKVILAGQKISQAVLGLIKTIFPEARVINGVGSQETSGYMVSFSDKNSAALNILKTLPGLEYKLINKEICIKDTWPGLAMPFNNKKAYSSRWHGRFFRTGDLAKKTKSGLELIGRSDKVVKYRGRQISLEYLEEVIGAQPFVKKARCLIVQGKPKPEIRVFIMIKSGDKKYSLAKLENSVRKNIESKFGKYMNSGKIIFVDEFPTSASGKIMEKLLLKKYA